MSKIITFGEIMMRLSAKGKNRFSQATHFDVTYGGSESNTASSLSRFGLTTAFITRLPDNELGDAALMELKKHDLQVGNVLRGGERLGLYFLEHGSMVRPSKVIYDRSGSAMASIEIGMLNWTQVFKDCTWFHFSGITPGISKSAAQVTLEAIKEAKKQGLTVSIDLNYRNNLWNYIDSPKEIMTELIKYCDVVMGGAEDIFQYFELLPNGVNSNKENTHDLDSYKSLTEKLLAHFPNIKTVVYSLRESISASHNGWSALLFEGRSVYKGKKYDLTHIVDRVGAGDALTAGIIYGLNTFEGDMQKTLEFGIAASALKHSISCDVNLVSVGEVMSLMSGNASGRVER